MPESWFARLSSADLRAVLMGLLICIVPAQPAGSAELAPDLHTDRDAFTPATVCIPSGTVLTEGSYVFIDNQTGLPTNSYPELLWRIGATSRFEWRIGVNYSVGTQGNVVTSVEVGELPLSGNSLYESNLLYGFKMAVTQQIGLLPESCFIMEATTPTFGELFGTSPVATYVFGWELPATLAFPAAEPWRVDAAIRYAYAEAETNWFSRWGPSVVLRMPVTDRWEVHAEYFGTFTQGLVDDSSRSFFSPGTHYLLTDTFEVGLRVGWGLGNDAANFFSDAGFGWRW
ncbi:MAG: transporter [Planctomycetia bacterium]